MILRRMTWLGGLALAALVLFPMVAGCGGKEKKKKKKEDKKVTIDMKSKWGDVRAMGAEGKWLCEQGLSKYQSGATTEERNKGCEMMVEGIEKVQKAIEMGDNLLETARKREPGKDFTGYGDEMAGWMQSMTPAKKSLPNEYIDKLAK